MECLNGRIIHLRVFLPDNFQCGIKVGNDVLFFILFVGVYPYRLGYQNVVCGKPRQDIFFFQLQIVQKFFGESIKMP